MTNDQTITLTLAELRAVARLCEKCSDRLITKSGKTWKHTKLCDVCSDSDFSLSDVHDALTIRAVQACIDGLSAQPARMSDERWVVAFADSGAEFGPSFETQDEAESYAVRVARVFSRDAKAVRL